MVNVKGIEAELIEVSTPEELMPALNRKLQNLVAYKPEYTIIGMTKAVVYHNGKRDKDADKPGFGRYCCECAMYEWGKSCPLKEGYIPLKQSACECFTVSIKVGGGAN